MSPELTGFALGLLLGAAKVMTIGTIGFGIAWWRARKRVRVLEADLQESEQLVDSLTGERDALLAERSEPRLPGPVTPQP